MTTFIIRTTTTTATSITTCNSNATHNLPLIAIEEHQTSWATVDLRDSIDNHCQCQWSKCP